MVVASYIIGIGIGIGIEMAAPVLAKLLADRVAMLSELRQHGHNTIEQCLHGQMLHGDFSLDSDSDSDPDPDCAPPTK